MCGPWHDIYAYCELKAATCDNLIMNHLSKSFLHLFLLLMVSGKDVTPSIP